MKANDFTITAFRLVGSVQLRPKPGAFSKEQYPPTGGMGELEFFENEVSVGIKLSLPPNPQPFTIFSPDRASAIDALCAWLRKELSR